MLSSREDTASTETPASGLADKTPALSSDAEDVHKPVMKAQAFEKCVFEILREWVCNR